MTMSHNKEEVAKFSALATDWWEPGGSMCLLHRFNPLRMSFISEQLGSLVGKQVVDIGCGGGLLTESLIQQGALVTGIDESQALIEVAKQHQQASHLGIDYLCMTPTELVHERRGHYDIVTCFEVLEHVSDPASFLSAAAALLKPRGHLFCSTVNRSLSAYLIAILGAEYILKWLPKQTHHYANFIRPSELSAWARTVGFMPRIIQGVRYRPLLRQFQYADQVAVHYFFYATLETGTCL